MRIYKYQIENELKELDKIDKYYFYDYIERLTSGYNKLIRVEDKRYYCTHCHKWHEDKKVKINSQKKCPHCNRVFEVIGKRNVIKKLQGYITVLETNKRNELIIRQFYFYKLYDKLKMSFDWDCFEIERINLDRDIYMKMNAYSNMGYIQHVHNGKISSDRVYRGGYYTPYSRYAETYMYTNVITKGIRKLLNNTAYKYSCLDIIARKHIDIYDYLIAYKIHNELELFVKNGNFEIVKDIIRSKTFPSVLNNRKNLRYLKNDINTKELENAVQYNLSKIEDIKAYGYVNLIRNEAYIQKHNLNIRKTCHYLYNQKQSLNYYSDYLDMANKLGMCMSDTRVLYPKNLVKAHDNVMKYYEDNKNEIITKGINDFAKELEKYNFENRKLTIFPAHSQEELINESKKLEHCVRGYAKEMSNRKTSIFFIRKRNDRNEPYVTLELRGNIVIQCRGYGNNVKVPLDKKVKEFVNIWCNKFNFKSCFS